MFHNSLHDAVKQQVTGTLMDTLIVRITMALEQSRIPHTELLEQLNQLDTVTAKVFVPGMAELLCSHNVNELMEKLPLNSLIELMEENDLQLAVSHIIVKYKEELNTFLIEHINHLDVVTSVMNDLVPHIVD